MNTNTDRNTDQDTIGDCSIFPCTSYGWAKKEIKKINGGCSCHHFIELNEPAHMKNDTYHE